ncbi:MAG: ABC transporter ATP-binding protein [Kiritimatiellaeota bacterium]|nr:ABC transporter ATP-binding protein [Kiritimatiellota bacterium]
MLLRLENVEFAYEVGPEAWSLRVASLTVKRGEVLSIIGPNGSGKSTLLRLAAGVIEPGQGRVWLGDILMTEMDRAAVARRLGYLPQHIRPQFDLRAGEIAALGRRPHLLGLGRLRRRDRTAVEAAMRATETLHLSERLLSQLSGGERRRVFLASVLAQEPRVLLLDEPTASLDLHHQVLFFRRLRGLADSGMGVMVVTHDLNLASLFSDRVVLLDRGRIRHRGPATDVVNAEIIKAVYGPELRVDKHPEIDRPIVLPRTAPPP